MDLLTTRRERDVRAFIFSVAIGLLFFAGYTTYSLYEYHLFFNGTGRNRSSRRAGDPAWSLECLSAVRLQRHPGVSSMHDGDVLERVPRDVPVSGLWKRRHPHVSSVQPSNDVGRAEMIETRTRFERVSPVCRTV